ncbi:MAG: hypothetical protein ACRENE_14660 [Polyangiaceae bacterium]
MCHRLGFLSVLAAGAVLLGPACSSGGSTGGPSGQTGSSCSATSQCFPGVDAGALRGQATCLTQLQGGYCTHTCTSDADCCAIPGECRTGFKEVCASFESSNQTYCFLSCAAADVAAAPNAGTTDPTTYCQDWAGPTFTCRSTGGGSQNQKFCGP